MQLLSSKGYNVNMPRARSILRFILAACLVALGGWSYFVVRPIFERASINGKERKTAGAVYALMEALEDYYHDYGRYPNPGYQGTSESLPVRGNSIPDGFGNALIYYCSQDGQTYIICSTGQDGKLDKPLDFSRLVPEMIYDPDRDYIASNGVDYHWYEGQSTDGGWLERRHNLNRNEHALIRSSNNIALLTERAGLLLNAAGVDAAIPIMRMLDQEVPDDPAILALLDDKQIGPYDHEKALKLLNMVIRLRPDDSNALEQRGFEYIYFRQMDLAVQDLKRTIQLNPYNSITPIKYRLRKMVHQKELEPLCAAEIRKRLGIVPEK